MSDLDQLDEPDAESVGLLRVLRALSDPARLRIVRRCVDHGEYSCVPVRIGTEHLHEATLFHHLRVLREAGVTTTRVEGRHHRVRLRSDVMETKFPGLADRLLGERYPRGT